MFLLVELTVAERVVTVGGTNCGLKRDGVSGDVFKIGTGSRKILPSR
jgi:hypothetical protein